MITIISRNLSFAFFCSIVVFACIKCIRRYWCLVTCEEVLVFYVFFVDKTYDKQRNRISFLNETKKRKKKVCVNFNLPRVCGK